jgi:hypothetical protein
MKNAVVLQDVNKRSGAQEIMSSQHADPYHSGVFLLEEPLLIF